MQLQDNTKKVVIVYLCWGGEPYTYLRDALLGISQQTYPREQLTLVIVYNAHPLNEASAYPYIEQCVAEFREPLPRVVLLEQEENLGFSGGNNVGMKWALVHGFDYLFLHNADGYLSKHCIEELVRVCEEDNTIAEAQALILLEPESHLVNSAGNSFHYLGFGFCDQHRQEKSLIQGFGVRDIGYASGAAVLLRVSLLKQYGLWEEEYFLYHEDTDYSFRMRLLGYRVVLAPKAEFFHKYHFARNRSKYYWMQRNRFAILLQFFHLKTLLLILPMLLVVEAGLLFTSLQGGWWREQFTSYRYWLSWRHWRFWLKKRVKIQESRKITEQDFIQYLVSEIHFQEGEGENFFLRSFGNPLMRMYWRCAKKLLQ